MGKRILLLLIFLLAGCSASGRFGETEKYVYTGRPVESFDGSFITRIPSDWLFVDENENSSLFLFTNSGMDFLLSLNTVSGENLNNSKVISALRARVKIENKILNMSDIGEYYGVEGFYFTVQDNSLYNIFVYESNGQFWESKLYIDKKTLGKKENLIRLQAEILKNIKKN